MSAPTPVPDAPFTRRSETDSVCMYCFATVRVPLGESLSLEELLHSAVCPAMPDDVRRSVREERR